MRRRKFSWSTVYLIFVFILLYIPIFYLIFYSFNQGGNMSSFTGFTWEHYQSLFSDSRLISIVVQTFVLAFLSALLATIIGVLKNFQLGFVSVLLSHIAFSIPIVVLMVLPKLKEMNDSMIDAARDLGANNFQVLSNIILPFLTPGIIAGYFMAFTYSLDDFAVTFFVTGNGFTTLSVEIYSRARQGISLEINALSTLVFIFSLLLVVGYYFISRDTSKKARKRKRDFEEVAILK